MTILVIKPGLFTTVQDLGRFGYAHFGISPAGAADPLSLRIANLLVGNDENTPALEMTLRGATLQFVASAVIAITGAGCECRIDQDLVPANSGFEVTPGAVLQCGSMATGARSYLAVQGGLDIAPVMGSTSTFVPARFGGFHGRRLQSDDLLQVRKQESLPVRALSSQLLDHLHGQGPLRVTRGAQQDWFGADEFAELFSGSYAVSEQSDRTGLRLKGKRLELRKHAELLTDGIPLGAIQIPHDGQPIIMFVDQQTTGGYPKIANVIAADMHRVGQLRPRDEVQFEEVTIPEAIEALRQREERLKELFH